MIQVKARTNNLNEVAFEITDTNNGTTEKLAVGVMGNVYSGFHAVAPELERVINATMKRTLQALIESAITDIDFGDGSHFSPNRGIYTPTPPPPPAEEAAPETNKEPA